MPTITPQIDPERPLEPEQPRSGDAPLTFVPHDASASKPIRTIRTGRYGELEEHELIRLLDTIEDERARGRFRESIYISLFVWMAIAWVVLYGPRYLWHAPQLVNPADVLKQREMVELNAPRLSRVPVPTAHPTPKPTLDNKTLEHLRAMAPKPEPLPPTPQPQPSTAAPIIPAPTAPSPTPTATRPAAPIADAPTPQPTTRPNFSTPSTASDALNSAIRGAARGRGSARDNRDEVPTPKGANAGGGVEVLSDTQGVDFSHWLARMHGEIMRNWLPLLPEETEPPLMKRGETFIIVTILPDGTIGDMKLEGSTHDQAIDKAAWGSIVSEGQFQALPREFHGPNLILRFHYIVN